jgi:hypothetical protein
VPDYSICEKWKRGFAPVPPVRSCICLLCGREEQNDSPYLENNGAKETKSSLCASYHKKMKKV